MTERTRSGVVRWGGWKAAAIAALVGSVFAGSVVEAASDWTIAAYLAGDGDLAEEAVGYLNLISSGAVAARWNAAVQIDLTNEAGDCAASRHLWATEDGTRRHAVGPVPGREAGINMGDGETLRAFLGWVRKVAPAERYALIVMGHGVSVGGHGTGAVGGPAEAGLAVDASSGGDALRPVEVGEALAGAGPGDDEPWIDAVFLDCCFGASVDMAYELRDVARWMCGPAGLIASPGVPWGEALAIAKRDDVADGRGLVEACLTASDRGAEIELAALDLAGMDEVGEAARRLSQAGTRKMSELAPDVTLARSRSEIAAGGGELCDAAAFAAELAENVYDEELAAAARAMAEAIENCTLRPGTDAGPALLVPGLLGRTLPEYLDGGSGLAQLGWGEFVEAYVKRLRELMGRAADDGVGAEA